MATDFLTALNNSFAQRLKEQGVQPGTPAWSAAMGRERDNFLRQLQANKQWNNTMLNQNRLNASPRGGR